MALGSAQERLLVLGRQGAQGVGQGGADLPPGELVLGRRRQACSDLQATSHPLGFALKGASDPSRGEAVLVPQRAHHPRLIQCGRAAGRTVGQKQQTLVLCGGTGGLDHHGDELVALLTPTLQALEAVDDLIQALLGGHDTDGQLGQIVGSSLGEPGSQRRVAGAQPPDRQEAEAAGGARDCGQGIALLRDGNAKVG